MGLRLSRLPAIVTTASAIALLGLAGCSSTTNTSEESAPAATEPVEAEAAEAESPATGREVPAVCAGLDLSLGSQLDGTPFGDCVALALSSFGSGKMKIAGETTGEFEFTYDPDYNVQGELTTPTGPMKIAFVGTDMWIDSGNGPVKGNPESEDPEEMMAALAGELTRQYADVTQTAQLMQGQPVWNIADAKEPITVATGEQVDAYRIVSAGPFEWNGIPITEYVAWFDDDWVPLSTQATMEVMGMSGTNSQHFYDLGEPVTIKALG